MNNALPYLLLVLVYGLLAFYYQHTQTRMYRTYISALCIIIFIFFFGFRGFIYYDWINYYPSYESIGGNFATDMQRTRWEPGFMLLAFTIKHIYPSYQFFIWVCTLINISLLVRFFNRYVDNLPLALIVFLCMNGIVLSTDLMRNSIAILIFINILHYIPERKPIHYFFWCLVAASFHTTALCFIPLYFILNRSYNKWLLLSIFIVANLVYIFHIPVLKSLLSLFFGFISPTMKQWIDSYLTMDATTGSILSIGYIERLLTGILVFCYLDRLRSLRKESNIFINSLLIFLYLFLFLSEFRTISMRVSGLFSYGYWIIWVDLLKCFYYRNNRILFISFLAIYCLLKTYSNNKSKMSYYYNVLFENRTYTERALDFNRNYYDGEKK